MVRDSACDLIIFGVSGYTGRLVAEYLAPRYGKKIKWGMAGAFVERNIAEAELELQARKANGSLQ